MEVMFERLDTPGRGGKGMCEQIFHPEKQHQQETEQLHRGLEDTGIEQLREAGECNGAVNHLHDCGAQSDEESPAKTASGALIDDGDIDRPDRNGDQKPADEAGKRSDQVFEKMGHARLR
jgi:hypothetical protein